MEERAIGLSHVRIVPTWVPVYRDKKKLTLRGAVDVTKGEGAPCPA